MHAGKFRGPAKWSRKLHRSPGNRYITVCIRRGRAGRAGKPAGPRSDIPPLADIPAAALAAVTCIFGPGADRIKILRTGNDERMGTARGTLPRARPTVRDAKNVTLTPHIDDSGRIR